MSVQLPELALPDASAADSGPVPPQPSGLLLPEAASNTMLATGMVLLAALSVVRVVWGRG